MTKLTWKTSLKRSPEEVFEFLSQSSNIKEVYPPDLGFRLLEGPERVGRGSERVFRIFILGQSFLCRSRFTMLRPPEEIHEELDFPSFKMSSHRMTLRSHEGGTALEDEVDFSTALGPLGNLFAKRIMAGIMEYRSQALRRALGEEIRPSYHDPLKIGLRSGTLSSLAFVVISVLLISSLPSRRFFEDMVLGMVSWVLLWLFTHDLAHFFVGSLAGVSFSHYYIGLSNIVRLKGLLPSSLSLLPLVLGIKIDRAKSKAGRVGFAAMYLAGPVASMVSPAFVPLWILAREGESLAGLVLLSISVANILFTIYFSPKAGCIMKARKAARARRERM